MTLYWVGAMENIGRSESFWQRSLNSLGLGSVLFGDARAERAKEVFDRRRKIQERRSLYPIIEKKPPIDPVCELQKKNYLNVLSVYAHILIKDQMQLNHDERAVLVKDVERLSKQLHKTWKPRTNSRTIHMHDVQINSLVPLEKYSAKQSEITESCCSAIKLVLHDYYRLPEMARPSRAEIGRAAIRSYEEITRLHSNAGEDEMHRKQMLQHIVHAVEVLFP